MATKATAGFLETVLSLSRFHREHETFYGQAPLQSAIAPQSTAQTLKTSAGRWSDDEPASDPARNPYAGCEDLNQAATLEHDGALFELGRLRRDLAALADDSASRALARLWRRVESVVEMEKGDEG